MNDSEGINGFCHQDEFDWCSNLPSRWQSSSGPVMCVVVVFGLCVDKQERQQAVCCEDCDNFCSNSSSIVRMSIILAPLF